MSKIKSISKINRISVVTAIGIVLLLSGAAQATTIIPYLDTGYKFKVVPQGDGSGFEQIGFDDSGFSIGDAGFGTQSGGCSLSNPTDAKTDWPLGTDMLLRKEFILPPGATNLKVSVAIDNDIQVFINGADISGGLQNHEGCPTRDSFVFTAPDGILNTGTNLIAVRGRDRGVLSYLDVQVTVTAGPPPPVPELNTIILTSAGLFGLFIVSRRYR